MINLFWINLFILLYHIFGYGTILKILSIFKTKEQIQEIILEYPTITVLCPAYNEEKYIEAKIESFLKLDYPKDKIKMIVISDDSVDKTNEIVEAYNDENIRLVVQKPRKGKPSGHNLVEPSIDTDYVVSTDANSIFHKNAIKELVKTFISNPKIGMAIGQLKLVSNGQDSGEGAYWKFENFLKKSESKIHSIICANGSLFMLKRELFTQIHPSSVDDFERTLITLENGFIARFNKNAIVTEDVTEKPTEEINRKIRIISREWFALFRHPKLLNPFMHITTSFFLVSHKIIRWLLPIWTISILVGNLYVINQHPFFLYFAILQICGYFAGFTEILLEKYKFSFRLFKLPAYFLLMNYSSSIALFKVFRGQQQSTWSTKR